MYDKKITLKTDGTVDAASAVAATISDAFTTVFSSDVALTGMPKFVQLGALFAAGAAWQSHKRAGTLAFWS